MKFIQKIIILQLTCICYTQTCNFLRIFGNNPQIFKTSINTLPKSNTSESLIKWIEQPIDHFNANDNRTWKMQYFEKLDYWQPESPIYLYINKMSDVSDEYLNAGLMHELAKETNGAMYALERRFYGESQPFEIYTLQNFAYLNSRQALADIAKLLKEIKQLPQYKDSKVVAVGGAYAGNLAVWLKLLYPELVDAVIASSAPVLAKKDFYEFYEAAGDVYKKYGTPGCYEKIKKEFQRIVELFKTSAGMATIKKEYGICEQSDLTKPENKQVLFSTVADLYAFEAMSGTTEGMKTLCDKHSNMYGVWSDDFTKNDNCDLWNQSLNCFYIDYDMLMEMMKKSGVPSLYQTCTEFGQFRSTSSNKQPFTYNIHVDFYYNMCTKVYGPEFDEKRVDKGVKDTNEMFGGLKPNVTHVVFVNGELDPYARLSVLEDLSPDAPAKVIPRTGNCKDLEPEDPNDDEELKEARKYVKQLIKKWINAA